MLFRGWRRLLDTARPVSVDVAMCSLVSGISRNVSFFRQCLWRNAILSINTLLLFPPYLVKKHFRFLNSLAIYNTISKAAWVQAPATS